MVTRFSSRDLLPLLGRLFLLGAQLLLPVAELGGLLEVLLAYGLLLLAAHLLDLLVSPDVRGPVERRDARAGARLVHDVDRLVRQEAAGPARARLAARRSRFGPPLVDRQADLRVVARRRSRAGRPLASL